MFNSPQPIPQLGRRGEQPSAVGAWNVTIRNAHHVNPLLKLASPLLIFTAHCDSVFSSDLSSARDSPIQLAGTHFLKTPWVPDTNKFLLVKLHSIPVSFNDGTFTSRWNGGAVVREQGISTVTPPPALEHSSKSWGRSQLFRKIKQQHRHTAFMYEGTRNCKYTATAF